MEIIKYLPCSVEKFIEELEKQGPHKVFSDIRADLDMQDSLCNNSIADKLCELQHDHTWTEQAVCNLTVLFSECYDKVRKMQNRINSLENEVRIMTEPKKGG